MLVKSLEAFCVKTGLTFNSKHVTIHQINEYTRADLWIEQSAIEYEKVKIVLDDFNNRLARVKKEIRFRAILDGQKILVSTSNYI